MGNKRIRDEGRKRERAHWNTPEKTEPARQDKLAEEERGSEREGENVRTIERERGGSRRSRWHAAAGSSITVSPPSGRRSEELPPSPPALLRSPSLFLALPSCYVIKLEEQ